MNDNERAANQAEEVAAMAQARTDAVKGVREGLSQMIEAIIVMWAFDGITKTEFTKIEALMGAARVMAAMKGFKDES